MKDKIDDTECPKCKSTNTETIDILYNEELRHCKECGSKYQVRYIRVAYCTKLL